MTSARRCAPRFSPLRPRLALFLLAAGVVSACGLGPSEPGRFYVLSSPPDLVASEVRRPVTIGVGPVALPPHLDRTQIVTQATRHRLDLMDLDQWAEPLGEGFTRVLAENLSKLVGTDAVFQFPWRRPVTVQYQVTVNVQRFDTDAGGESILAARWDIIRGDGQELLFSRTSRFRSRASPEGIEPIVAAMSANLAELSREIAAGLTELAK